MSLDSKANFQFCFYFGRVVREGAKRARNQDKYFEAPFTVDKYKQHHNSQHKQKWEEYKKLDATEKAMYFDGLIPRRTTLAAFFQNLQQGSLRKIRRSIVEDAMFRLYWREDEDDDSPDGLGRGCKDHKPTHDTQERMRACFGELVDDDDEGHYEVRIQRQELWRMVVKLLAIHGSFRAVGVEGVVRFL